MIDAARTAFSSPRDRPRTANGVEPSGVEARRERAFLERRIHRSFLHGMLRLYVLKQAAESPLYGGALSRSLRRLGYAISPGSLYPLLHSLERERLLRRRARVVRGRSRQDYEVTALGRACLASVRTELEPLVRELVVDPLDPRTEVTLEASSQGHQPLTGL